MNYCETFRSKINNITVSGSDEFYWPVNEIENDCPEL